MSRLLESITKHGGSSSALLAVSLLRLCFEGAYLKHQGAIWKPVKGVPTGTSPGVMVANIYLDCFDAFLARWDGLVYPLLTYMRFVDDTLCAIHVSEVQKFRSYMDSWHGSLKFEVVCAGRENVPFLDLSLSVLESGYIGFKTHRKDLNEYLYVPRSSCHPSGFFSGIVLGENCRLDRTNSGESSRLDAVRFFEQKLSVRGYNKSCIRAVVTKRKKKKKFSLVPSVVPVKKVFLKVVHSSVLNAGFVTKSFEQHEALLHGAVGKTSFCLAKAVQKNEFRRRYLQWRREE